VGGHIFTASTTESSTAQTHMPCISKLSAQPVNMASVKKAMDARDAKAGLQLKGMGNAGFGKRRWLHDL